MYSGQSTSGLAHHGHSTAQAPATNRQTNLSQAETVLFSTLINAVGDLPELDFLRGLIKQKNRTITELQSELDMLKADFQDFRKQFEDRGEEDDATPAEKEKTKEKEEGQITKPMPVKREIIVEEAEASGQSQGNANTEMPLANNTNDDEAPAEPFDWPAEQFIDAGIPEAEKKRVIIGDSLAQALLGVLPGSELILIKPEEGNAEIIRSLIALPGRVRAVIMFTGRDALLAGDTVASILERFGRLWTLLSRFPAKIFWVPPPYVRQKAVEHADLVTNMRQKFASSALVGTTASGRSIFELWRFGDSFNKLNVTPTGMPTLNGQKALRAWLFTQAPEFPGDRQMHHPLTNEPARARASTSASNSKPKPNPKPFRHPAPRNDDHHRPAAGNNYHRDRWHYERRPAADEYSSRSRSPRERDYPSPPIEVWSQEHNFLPSLPSPSFQSRFHRQ